MAGTIEQLRQRGKLGCFNTRHDCSLLCHLLCPPAGQLSHQYCRSSHACICSTQSNTVGGDISTEVVCKSPIHKRKTKPVALLVYVHCSSVHRCRAHPSALESFSSLRMLVLTLETSTTTIWPGFYLLPCTAMFGLKLQPCTCLFGRAALGQRLMCG